MHHQQGPRFSVPSCSQYGNVFPMQGQVNVNTFQASTHNQAMQNIPTAYNMNTAAYGSFPQFPQFGPYGTFGSMGPFVCPNPCCNPNAPLCPCKIRSHKLQVDKGIQTDENVITAGRFTKDEFFTSGTDASKLLNVSIIRIRCFLQGNCPYHDPINRDTIQHAHINTLYLYL